MNEPAEEPEPPSELPDSLISEVDGLDSRALQRLIRYAASRLRYLEASVADLIEPDDDEEIIQIKEHDLYTIVVKGHQCEEGCDSCPHDPHTYMVTLEPDIEGGRHLHWEDLGPFQG